MALGFNPEEQVKKFAEQQLGLKDLGISAQSSAAPVPDGTVDRLTTKITPERWNEVHTYYFAVAMADADGRVTNNFQPAKSVNESNTLQNINTKTNREGASFEVEADSAPDYKFTKTIVPLAIPPSALSVNVQFASSVVATNRGVLEENNGVVFRTITISGTTGVWRGRRTDRDTKAPASASFQVSQLFPSAVSAIQNLVKAAKGVIGGDDQSSKSKTLEADDLQNTGYYQFWLLHNFFLEYANNKKKRNSRSLRLLFGSPKDNITYVVTPVSFDLRRDAGNPLQYRYAVVLRCWDITSAKASLSTNLDQVPDAGNPLTIRNLADRLRRARRAINEAGNVIKAVQSDIFEILNTVNQATLAVKDIVGLEQDLMDFAPTLKQNIDTMIANNKAQWAQILQDNGAHGTLTQLFLEGNQGGNALLAALTGGVSLVVGDMLGITQSAATAAGLDPGFSVNAKPSGEKSTNDLTDVAGSKVIGDFLDTPDLAENTPLSDLGTLPKSLQNAIDDQVQKAKDITANDVYQTATKLKEVSENIAYSTGMMDPTYANLYGLPEPQDTGRKPTEDDVVLSAQIEDGRDALLGSLATGTIYGEKPDNPYAAANQVLETDDQLPTPLSAVPVFVQRGSSLDDMAKLYLGDANRAREIAILNELRAPYIDEQGFNLSIALASGRSFVVNDRSNLVVNQKIRLFGNGLAATRRTILAINDIGGGQFRVIVDGQPNLDQFDASHAPMLNARQPGTIGSGDTILIPVGNPSDQDLTIRQTSLLERLSHAERTFKVDMALDTNGDLAVGPDGDFSKSFGYANAVQALRILVETEQGELEQHPTYGIDAGIGNTINGNVVQNINQSVQNAVLSDPRFQNADVNAQLDGTALRIRVDAQGSNGTGLIPVEFKVTT